MFAVFCLLLVLGLGHCQDNDLPSRIEIESSINRTIEEVERQIREDPRLPQLSRQDIVKFLENITSQDVQSIMDKEKIDRTRKLYQRALMVVLPYNAAESPGSLNDLYTKPPMTRIIPDSPKPIKTPEFEADKSKQASNDVKDFEFSTLSTEENLITGASRGTTEKDDLSALKNRYKNHRETYSDVRTKVPLKETLKLDSTPVRFSFNLENLQKNGQAAEKTTTMRYPVYRNDESKNSRLEIVYSTSVTEVPTTKPGSREITINLEKPKNNQNVLSSAQWRYNAPPSSAVMPTMPAKVPFLPTINSELHDHVMVSSTERSGVSSEALKMNEDMPFATERSAPIFVTPMPTETSSKAKFSSTYSLNSAGFRSVSTTSTPSSPMRQEVMDLLASIGLKPDNNSNVEDVYKKHKDILKNKLENPETSNLIYTTLAGLTSVGPDSLLTDNQNTFDGPGSEIQKGMKNLTPDVQLLFQRFGIETSNLDQSTSTTTQRTTVNLNSYTNFKPLPTSSVKDDDMKEFLARFGLGISENRRQKSMRQTTKAPSLIEAVPGNMRSILENIGLISNSNKSKKTASKSWNDMQSTETSKIHVFKPHEVKVGDENQRNKINELLDTVKLAQEGKADIQNVRKVANDLLKSTKILKDGPDPLNLEDIIKTYNEDLRNEVKRQQEETTTTASKEETTLSSLAATESTETTLATPSTNNSTRAASEQSDPSPTTESSSTTTVSTTPNLRDLEDSFGGTTKEPDPVLPQRRKSGLYFLVDWNSFLEVGEDDKEKINLRFQPKVGDRTRFLSVSVP